MCIIHKIIIIIWLISSSFSFYVRLAWARRDQQPNHSTPILCWLFMLDSTSEPNTLPALMGRAPSVASIQFLYPFNAILVAFYDMHRCSGCILKFPRHHREFSGRKLHWYKRYIHYTVIHSMLHSSTQQSEKCVLI